MIIHRKPDTTAKKVGLIIFRILLLAAIFHVSAMALDHIWLASKFGRDEEIVLASIADHLTFGWD